MTADSFGDVSEIMEHVPYDRAKPVREDKAETSLYKIIVDGVK